jgi:hypothetical protein
MLPRLITLSLALAEVENSVPWGRTKPRFRWAISARDKLDRDETDEAVETERSNGGHAPRAGVGDVDGDGEVQRTEGGGLVCEEEASC